MRDSRPSSLVSRLQARMASRGSILFKLIWKVRYTKLNTPIYALRASARRTSDKDSSGWPSPLVNDAKGSNYTYNQGRHDSISLKLGGAAQLVSPWATPAARDYHSESATDAFNEKRWSHSRGKPLSAQATLSTWVSPQAADANGSGLNQHTASLCKQARQLASWPSPTASLGDKGVRTLEGGIQEAMRSKGPDLAAVSCLASWGTPTARELGGTPERQQFRFDRFRARGVRCGNTQPSGLNLQVMLATWPTPRTPTGGAESAQRKQELGRMDSGGSDLAATAMAGTPAQLVSGQTANGSSAETANTGQLNPAFSRWLQGYPAVWDECAIRAFRSIPTTRRKREP